MRMRLAQTIGTLLDAELGPAWSSRPLAIAVSGGPDSVALAWAAAALTQSRGTPLHFFHVHHGLMDDADHWVQQVQRLAQHLGAQAHIVYVQIDLSAQMGEEAAARQARYDALCQLAQQYEVSTVLLGHHQDDQLETLLFRLFRGTGLAGMAGMPVRKHQHNTVFLRPLLSTPRADLLRLAEEGARSSGILLAEDPSNHDLSYARGQLRQAVIPAIQTHWPGYRQTLLRFSQHCIEAEAELAALTAQDFQNCQAQQDANRLSTQALAALSPWRAQRVLRSWLQQQSIPVPTEQRLRQWQQQLTQSAPDRHLELKHERWVIHRFRGQVYLLEQVAMPAPQTFRWAGEDHCAFPAFRGTLHVERAEAGLDPEWLAQQTLVMDVRRGGERLRLHAGGPRRSLKNLYQEAGVPPWQRLTLPLVRLTAGDLLWVAGCGQSVDPPQASPGVQLRWKNAE